VVGGDENPDHAGQQEDDNRNVVRGSSRTRLAMAPQGDQVKRDGQQDKVFKQRRRQRSGPPANDVQRQRRRGKRQRPSGEPQQVDTCGPQVADMLAASSRHAVLRAKLDLHALIPQTGRTHATWIGRTPWLAALGDQPKRTCPAPVLRAPSVSQGMNACLDRVPSG
jgi:hypothetical protein